MDQLDFGPAVENFGFHRKDRLCLDCAELIRYCGYGYIDAGSAELGPRRSIEQPYSYDDTWGMRSDHDPLGGN